LELFDLTIKDKNRLWLKEVLKIREVFVDYSLAVTRYKFFNEAVDKYLFYLIF